MRIQVKDLGRRIAEIPQHTIDVPSQAASPITHYQHGASEAWNLLKYFERRMASIGGHEKPLARHLTNLRNLTTFAIVESFERYLKELAALCIDQLAPHVIDDRFDCMGEVTTSRAVAHFAEGTVGRAVAESTMWSQVKDLERFNVLLQNLHGPDNPRWTLLPTKDRVKDPDYWRRESLGTLFQLRHTIAHNVALITRSDALKFQRLTRTSVAAPRVLAPSNGDVWYVKVFLDQTTTWLNERAAARLEVLLDEVLADNPAAFDPVARRDQLAHQLQRPMSIGGGTGDPR